MLVLTRKQSETIRIGDSITITVLRMKGKSVRLGIEAPLNMSVIRGELAFEPGDDNVLSEADEMEGPKPFTPPSRSCNSRSTPNDAWPANASHCSECAAVAWSI